MMLISKLSKLSETPIATIRYYERYGLIKGKKDTVTTTNNYTFYDEEILERLQLIREAKEIGFSLSEIKKLIDAWYNNRLSTSRKKEILIHKVDELDEKIIQLKNMKKLIAETIKMLDKDEY